ncbi:hypothetical protein ABQE93_10540 [Mycolicibacterium sp. XJ662]
MPVPAVPERLHRPSTIRDGAAGLLLILGVLLPWNIDVGFTITGTATGVLALLILVTLMSLAAVVLSHVGRFSIRSPGTELKALDRLRLLLNIPYLALAAGFVVFAVVQPIRLGGTVAVPPGVGPGAWLGVAGALLAAAPVITGIQDSDRRETKLVRIIGIVMLLLAVVAVLVNLYWRTRFVIPNIGDPDTGVQNSVVAVTAVLYGIVALLPVIVATRWIMSVNPAARLATVLLAVAALIAGVFVWVLPVGRDLDAFHGVAQNTSTAGVGFEGYLAWVVTAAIVGSGTLLAAFGRDSEGRWRAAARKCLILIAVWCAGTAVLRIFDLIVSSALDLPAPPYNSTALMAFDLVAAVLAAWLCINSSGKVATPRMLLMLLSGILFVLLVCRVILGVALVPRVEPLNPRDITEVYGNTLAQQITSTFDVALCVLALALLMIAIMTGSAVAKKPVRRNDATAPAAAEAAVAVSISAATAEVPSAQWTRPIGTDWDRSAPTIAMPSGQPGGAPATAKIFRPDTAQQAAPATDRIADVLAESTQRFAAGTTYGVAPTPHSHGQKRHTEPE